MLYLIYVFQPKFSKQTAAPGINTAALQSLFSKYGFLPPNVAFTKVIIIVPMDVTIDLCDREGKQRLKLDP